MLHLPDVTLVVAETRCHELMRLTLTDMVLKVKFGGIVIHTDKPELIGIPAPAEYIKTPDWPSKIAQGMFYYMEAPVVANTSHVLLMEWDAGLRDVGCWSDEFLQYDYIGAPWIGLADRRPGAHHTVGNGGFLLLSKRMADHVYPLRHQFQIKTDLDYSRTHRVLLEQQIGAKWAPESVAHRFSFENYGNFGQRHITAPPSFGYHDIFNWPIALPHDEVLRRTRLVMDNAYAVRNTKKLEVLAKWWPWVRREIGNLEYDAATRHSFRPPVQQRGRIKA